MRCNPAYRFLRNTCSVLPSRLGQSVRRRWLAPHEARCAECRRHRTAEERLDHMLGAALREAAVEDLPVEAPLPAVSGPRPLVRPIRGAVVVGLGLAAAAALVLWLQQPPADLWTNAPDPVPVELTRAHPEPEQAAAEGGTVSLVLKLPGVTLRKGDRAGISIIGVSARSVSPYTGECTLAASASGALPSLSVPRGKASIRVHLFPGNGSTTQGFSSFADLGKQRNEVTPASHFAALTEDAAGRELSICGQMEPFMNPACAALINDQSLEWLRTTALAAPDAHVMAACLKEGASLNFFDDLLVASGRTNLFHQTFDDYPAGETRPSLLRPVWTGRDGYVTHSLHAPGSGPASWVNMAHPRSNREDGFLLERRDLTPGQTLILGVSLMVTDVGKGVMVGLVRPYGKGRQAEPATIRFQDGFVRAGDKSLATFTAGNWYRLRVECSLLRDTMNVFLDDRLIRPDVKFTRSAEYGTDFTAFAISGVYFADPHGRDAPPASSPVPP